MDFIGIVGARKYKDKKHVNRFIETLPKDIVIVTSSCRGVCTWAIDKAKEQRLDFLVYKPDLKNVQTKFEVAERYYQRNRELIEKCDLIHAFISSEKGFAGGTKYEVEYALKLGRPVQLHAEGKISKTIHQYSLEFVDRNIDLDPAWDRFFIEEFCK